MGAPSINPAAFWRSNAYKIIDMKIKLFVLSVVIIGFSAGAGAQHVKVRIGFPVGISINAPGPAPVRGHVWIGPEWAWRGNRYECVPGYWAQPHHQGAIWVPGHWKYTRFGYKWVPGRWK